MKPTKSAANIIVNDSVAGVPASTDLLLFAPLPNTPLVTDAQHCSVADLVVGLGITFAPGSVPFAGASGLLTSDPGLLFNSSLEATDGTTIAWTLDRSAIVAHLGDAYPQFVAQKTHASSGDAGVALVTGHKIEALSSSTVASSFLSALELYSTFLGNDAAGSVIGAFVRVTNAGTVGSMVALQIDSVAGAGLKNRAIETGAGECYFGDTVQAQGYKSSDGSAGETAVIVAAGLVSITVKNGLVVAHA